MKQVLEKNIWYKLAVICWNDFKNKEDVLRIFKKSYARLKKHGFKGMVIRINKEYHQLNFKANFNVNNMNDYSKWIVENEQELELVTLAYEPKVSVITPTYNTNPVYLKEMIESVLSQSYTNFELCIADDASSNQETLAVLATYEKNQKIKIVYRKENGHISAATNSALSQATGEFIAFLDHDDVLAPHALYEMVQKLNEDRNLKLIYSDEDKIDAKGNRFNPHFKSGWNPDMFYSQNYICHFVMIKRDILQEIGGFREGYEGSQDYDMLLRSLKYISDDEIGHIEKILYHWRAIEGSTAYGIGEKDYAHLAGLRALQDYFTQKDPRIKVESGLLPTTYKVNYPIPDTSNPLVSLLIPTRDGYDILSKCIESILKITTYTNYEILILDNGTTCTKTLSYMEEKEKTHTNIKVLRYDHPFNYSAINNFGVTHAQGDIIGLINNDIEFISPNWLGEMLQHAIREDVGAVGAKLYYANDTIQHGGVILGIGGVAGHSHKYFPKEHDGYFSRLKIIQNYSAVTGACLLVKKELFKRVNGLNEQDLTIAFNDVDFCLKLQEKGYRNLWTPYAEAYHHESISRGKEDNPDKIARFNKEVEYMKKNWGAILLKDICYNTNLTKIHENFGINIDG